MHTSISEGKTLAEAIRKYSQLHLPGINTTVVVCPPFTHLTELSALLKDSQVKLGAQSCHYEIEGAFTGDVSAKVLSELNCQYVIIGHSERRTAYNEPGQILNAKVIRVLRSSMTPVLCIGETLEEKNNGKTEEVLGKQLKEGLAAISRDDIAKIVIAYEPVWAISTNKDNQGAPATPESVNSIHKFIRETLKEMFGADVALNTLILYGGSVKPENAKSFFIQSDIDGALVGGASLKSDSFTEIVDAANIPQAR
jgi:triosephosphate isomerase